MDDNILKQSKFYHLLFITKTSGSKPPSSTLATLFILHLSLQNISLRSFFSWVSNTSKPFLLSSLSANNSSDLYTLIFSLCSPILIPNGKLLTILSTFLLDSFIFFISLLKSLYFFSSISAFLKFSLLVYTALLLISEQITLLISKYFNAVIGITLEPQKGSSSISSF